MKHILNIIFFTFLLTAYAQVNATITSCDVLFDSDDGSKKDKKQDKKKTGTEEEEEEPDCD